MQHKLTLVCAPGGSGKTTLLSEFASVAEAGVVWYRLSSADRDPSVFADCLLQALASQGDLVKPRSGPPSDAWRTESVLPGLIHALSDVNRARHGHQVVVLDDYDTVGSSQAVNDLLAGILDLTPPGVHLVISSRSVPALPLARLRLNGDLLELGQEELALDEQELAAFLVEWRGLSLSEEELRLVLEKTGGWIAGVSMLCESLRSRDKGEVISFLRDFSGGSRVVYDYFADEILRLQEPAVQDFLIATSVLSELHRDLVNPLLGINDAQATLESLAANNVFLISHDERHDWYKYHPLFRDFLRARADRSLSQRALTQLHKRAAAAYASMENWGRAILHLRSAGSFAEAASIIERVADRYVDAGNLETVLHWLNSLPETVRRERPWLLAIEGRIVQRQGSYGQATAALTRAQTLFAERSDSKGLALVAVERALVSYRTGNHREAIDLLECSLGSAPDDLIRADMLGTLALNYRELGELERSARFGEAALKALGNGVDCPSRPGLVSRSLRVLAQTCLLQGNLDRALSLVLRARDVCLREQLCGLELGAVQCTLGLVRATRGELELGLQAFHEADQNGAKYVEPQRRRVSLWRGNIYTDLGVFGRAEECYEMAGLPTAERSWLYLRQHQLGRATSLAREGLVRLTGSERPLERACLLGALGLATGATMQMEKARKLLQEAATILANHGYAHHLASLRLHMARLQIESNQLASGTRLLRQTLATSENRGFYHFFWWDPELLAQLFEFVLEDGALSPYVERLAYLHQNDMDQRALLPLAIRIGGNGREPNAEAEKPGDVLTQRVADVLASCADTRTRVHIEHALTGDQLARRSVVRLHDDFGLTWREIEVFVAYYLDRRAAEGEGAAPLRGRLAAELCMTENTLKSHIKSIRRKLGLPATADSLQVYRLVVEQELHRE